MSRFNIHTAVPASGAATVVPSDATTFEPSQIYVGVGGNVAVKPADGSASVIFVGVPAGVTIPLLVTQVLSTGTTATTMLRIF